VYKSLFFLLFGIVIAFVGSEAQAANEKKFLFSGAQQDRFDGT
jgi:hypothetical protein